MLIIQFAIPDIFADRITDLLAFRRIITM